MPRFEAEVSKFLGLPVLPPWSNETANQETLPHDPVFSHFYRAVVEQERLLCRMLVKFPYAYEDVVMIIDKQGEIIGLAHKDECAPGERPNIRVWARDFT
jgi:hypothetical protein